MNAAIFDTSRVQAFLALTARDLKQVPREPLPDPVRARIVFARNVQRFSEFVLTEFDPRDAASWSKADALFRSAIMARDIVRGEVPQS